MVFGRVHIVVEQFPRPQALYSRRYIIMNSEDTSSVDIICPICICQMELDKYGHYVCPNCMYADVIK